MNHVVCNMCNGRSFDSVKLWLIHLRVCHTAASTVFRQPCIMNECKHSGKDFTKYRTLQTHLRRMHGSLLEPGTENEPGSEGMFPDQAFHAGEDELNPSVSNYEEGLRSVHLLEASSTASSGPVTQQSSEHSELGETPATTEVKILKELTQFEISSYLNQVDVDNCVKFTRSAARYLLDNIKMHILTALEDGTSLSSDVLDEYIAAVLQPLDSMLTPYQRLRLVKDRVGMVTPQQVLLPQTNAERCSMDKRRSFVYVPVVGQIQALFKNDVLTAKLFQKQPHSSTVLDDVSSGSRFKSFPVDTTCGLTLQLLLYYDDMKSVSYLYSL